MTRPDLFPPSPREGFALLRGFVLPEAQALLDAVEQVASQAPPRRMMVPGGGQMSAAMTSCGQAGWVSDPSGYRYSAMDPDSGRPWPAMPKVIFETARAAADAAGFPGFLPDSCLINAYLPGAGMGLHQDRDEPDASAPIVSLSLGLPAVFLFGGLKRADPIEKMVLEHGDAVVWGGPLRRVYHGIAPLKDGLHPLLGRRRINLTLRKAL